MKIRLSEVHEIQQIQMQRIAAYEEHARKLSDVHWEGLKSAISSGSREEGGAEVLVAEIEGKIVGSVVLYPGNTDAYKGLFTVSAHPEIRMLAVDTHARKQGVARQLIEECIRRSEENGCEYIGLHTGEFMEDAIRLYEKIGFQHQPKKDFEPVNDGVMVKSYILKIQ
ncbi:GNAT family N-acetyltransferase [Rossellomorea vietnamensis]|uniref:GNAT family N-acetyltransferase n=1 Tax=Rossellomorea vietnamensis TaxID=218284 RepID=UPI003CF1F9B0